MEVEEIRNDNEEVAPMDEDPPAVVTPNTSSHKQPAPEAVIIPEFAETHTVVKPPPFTTTASAREVAQMIIPRTEKVDPPKPKFTAKPALSSITQPEKEDEDEEMPLIDVGSDSEGEE